VPGLTPKQEAFATAVASGKNQSEAYREAYDAGKMKPSSVNVNASKLMADAKVAQRVAELRKPVAEKAQITLESHLRDLMMLRNIAVKEKQISAAIAAEIARGKAAGVHVEKTESFVTTKELPASVDEFV
jgi:phage terminase small subunit